MVSPDGLILCQSRIARGEEGEDLSGTVVIVRSEVAAEVENDSRGVETGFLQLHSDFVPVFGRSKRHELPVVDIIRQGGGDDGNCGGGGIAEGDFSVRTGNEIAEFIAVFNREIFEVDVFGL